MKIPMLKNKKFGKLTGLLIILAILLLLPATALAATPADGTPIGDGSYFFANGTPINITATAPEGEEATISGLTTGTSAYISWEDNGKTKYVGVPATAVVFGGADGRSSAVSVDSASITMTGGTIFRIYGGNMGQNGTASDGTLDEASVVTGDVSIQVIGPAVVTDYLVGGGMYNAAVAGKVTIEVSDATLGSACYVQGGTHGNGEEGIRDIANLNIETNAYVNEVEITVIDSTADTVIGGGSGSTRVNTASVTIGDGAGERDTIIGSLYGGGINGITQNSTLNIKSDALVKEMAATNRGFVVNGAATIDGTIENLSTGAAVGCFSSDGNDSSAIIGQFNYKITANGSVEKAALTPSLIQQNGGGHAAEAGNITINNQSDTPLNITAPEFDAGSGITASEFTVSENNELSLQGNITLSVPEGTTLNNSGEINLGRGSALVVDNGVVNNNTNASINVQPGASITGDITGDGQIVHQSTTGTTTYRPDIDASEGGSVTVSPSRPEYGDKVTIKTQPEDGYQVAKVTVTDKDGDRINVTDNGDGTYSFIQPRGSVTIEVSFREALCDGGRDCPCYQFSDVDTALWYHQALDYVVANGLMNGTGSATFAPYTELSRGMLVTILWRMEEQPVVNYAMTFEDVAADAYYAEAIRWAAANEVVTGHSSSVFGPDEAITREQMAAILYRYAQYQGMEAITLEENLGGFADSGSISAYAVTAMNWAVGQGVINGNGSNMLAPTGTATRAEAAQMLMNYQQNIAPTLAD